MAELAAYTNAPAFTAIPSAVAVARGIRVTLASTGLVAASAISERGDYVTANACAASEPVACFSLQTGSIVPMTASEAIAIADPIYSAATGLVSKTSGGGAVLLGKAVTAATGTGILFEVLLENPA